ncbi:vacuolar ATPase assembly integral membrane protein vma21 [Saxophila tyrrhenica]|uniref:Vacuolar ATPase assembly integral membrane protein vma21 n=1 Tax=Saxophila tyrrhenica TaxID=1690608 RepID=A0AAV9PEJ1_9PEZI|nr:vacuolar ATPase assembly integral membrane protein vma21 [Saxophila tyrrhenica]
MATRRINASEKTHLDQDDSKLEPKSNISPAVPSSVIAKLLAFTAAMIVLPIGSYFMTVNAVFKGNSTWAGATAAIVANVVLIGYVIVAFQDDKSEREADEAEEKKKSR